MVSSVGGDSAMTCCLGFYLICSILKLGGNNSILRSCPRNFISFFLSSIPCLIPVKFLAYLAYPQLEVFQTTDPTSN
jgi:hypothetical protein